MKEGGGAEGECERERALGNNNDNNNKSTWVNTKVTSGDSKYESNKLIHT